MRDPLQEGQPFLDSDKGAQGPTAAAYFGDTLKMLSEIEGKLDDDEMIPNIMT